MNARHILLAVVSVAALLPVSVYSHDTPNIQHTHAFQQTAYGKYRQGHYVNGPQGSIIIWSPKAYTGYQNGNSVKFARPAPISRAPGSPVDRTPGSEKKTIEYGKR